MAVVAKALMEDDALMLSIMTSISDGSSVAKVCGPWVTPPSPCMVATGCNDTSALEDSMKPCLYSRQPFVRVSGSTLAADSTWKKELFPPVQGLCKASSAVESSVRTAQGQAFRALTIPQGSAPLHRTRLQLAPRNDHVKLEPAATETG